MKQLPILATLFTTFAALAGCAMNTEDVGGQSAAVKCDHDDNDNDVDARGAFTCDLRLAGDAFAPSTIAGPIERDRMIMSRANGFLHKQIPIALDFTHFSGGQPDLLTGGRYLYKTAEDAARYKDFVENNYVLDGVEFLDRSYWLDKECHNWTLIGAHDFTSIETQIVMRTERFQMGKHAMQTLKNAWPAVKAAAKSAGMATVWLGYNEDENLATLIYMHDRIVPYDPNVPDFASLGFLTGVTPLGDALVGQGFTRTFDRTQWVFTAWLPFVAGDHGAPSIWPNSPPFDEPYCGDGVCEVSRGESHNSCAADCQTHCGDAICQSGENDLNCPGDCGSNAAVWNHGHH